MTPDQYCEQKTAGAGSSFSYSFLFLEPAARRAMTVLYAFCREVDDVVDECTDPGIARIKLGWWRDEIARTYAGAAQHPVGKALEWAVSQFKLPQQPFLDIIAGMEMDLDYNAYRTFQELSLYCYRAAAAVGLLSAEIFGYEDPATLKYAHDLGMAFQLTNILRDVGEDARRGRVYIPEEDMASVGVRREDILEERASEAMTKLKQQQAARAHQYYAQAFGHLPEVDRYRQRSGIIMAAVYQALLREIEAGGFQVFGARVRLGPARKVWIAWQTARREKRQHLARTG